MSYMMLYAAPVPTAQKDAYVAHATQMAAIFKEHGCEKVVELWGDEVPPGEVTSFPFAVKLEEGETVAFGWQIWASKEARNAGMPKAMQDPRLRELGPPPMDGKRMIFAGFDVLLDA